MSRKILSNKTISCNTAYLQQNKMKKHLLISSKIISNKIRWTPPISNTIRRNTANSSKIKCTTAYLQQNKIIANLTTKTGFHSSQKTLHRLDRKKVKINGLRTKVDKTNKVIRKVKIKSTKRITEIMKDRSRFHEF